MIKVPYTSFPVTFAITVLLLGCIFFQNRRNIRLEFPADSRPFFIYFSYIIFQAFLCRLIVPSGYYYISWSLIIYRSLSYVLLAIPMLILGRTLFDFGFAMRFYKWMAGFAVVYLIVQWLSHYIMGITLDNLPAQICIYDCYETAVDISQFSNYIYRPASFFFEPSHFSFFVFTLLLFVLFGSERLSRWDYGFALFLSCGIFLSGSGWGLVGLLIFWGYFFLRGRDKYRKITCGICFLLVFFFFIKDMEFFQRVSSRIWSPGESSAATTIRISGFQYFFDLDVFPLQFFGTGTGNIPVNEYVEGTWSSVFFSTWAQNLHFYGYFGTLLLLIALFNIWLKRKGVQRVWTLFFGGLAIFSTIFIAYQIVFIILLLTSSFDSGSEK